MKPKVLIGSALKRGPQRYERRDPYPEIPFDEDLPKIRRADIAWGLASIVGFAALLIVAYAASV